MGETNNRPFITLKWAQTIDGQLADDSDQSQWISGPEERRYTHQVRAKNDAVLVGAQTFIKDKCQLTVRDIPLAVGQTQPVRVILDPRCRILELARKSRGFREALLAGNRRTYLLTDICEQTGAEATSDLLSGIVSITYRLEDLSSWLDDVLYLFAKEFAKNEGRQLKKIMVEGGPSTLALFLRSGIADQLEVAVSPLILGGNKNRMSTGNLLKNAKRFKLLSQKKLGADMVLRYRVPAFAKEEKRL